MTQPVEKYIIGVDVSKNKLDLYVLATDQSYSIINDTESIEQWLDSWFGPIRVAIKPTNTYHLAVAHAAYAREHQVHLIDPCPLAHYREGIGQRVKADHQDAQLLARYLQREAGELRLWEPLKHGPQ